MSDRVLNHIVKEFSTANYLSVTVASTPFISHQSKCVRDGLHGGALHEVF